MNGSPDDTRWREFTDIFETFRNLGFERYKKALFKFSQKWDCEVFPHGDKKLFHARALAYYQIAQAVDYSTQRQRQFEQSTIKLLIYNAGDQHPDFGHCQAHAHLDGLTLPKDHQFWNIWMPPLSPGCSCYVTGASSGRIAAIMGGDVLKAPPANWHQPQHPEIQQLFVKRSGPERQEIIAWIAAGNADLT